MKNVKLLHCLDNFHVILIQILKRMKKTILTIIAVLIVIVASLLIYGGAFKTAVAKETQEGGYTLIGIEHLGSYKKIGKTFSDFKKAIDALQLKDMKYAGVYFDDPQTVAEDSLHSMAAVIITNSADSAKVASMMVGNKKTMIHKIARGNAIVVDFPVTDMISMIIATMKAYPALGDYVKTHPQKSVPKDFYELYKDKETRFVMQF